MSLEKFFDSFEPSIEPIGSAGFNWSQKGCGFGQFYFYKKDGKTYISNEIMSRGFIKEQLCRLVDEAILDCPGRFDGDGTPEQNGIGRCNSEEG